MTEPIKPFYRICQKILDARIPVNGKHIIEFDGEEYAALDLEFFGSDDDTPANGQLEGDGK